MLLVPCPHCGPRNASEMTYVGEARTRPDTDDPSVTEWRDYLYMRDNTAGWTKETWYCRAGCRRYFQAERNTLSNEFRSSPVIAHKPERPA